MGKFSKLSKELDMSQISISSSRVVRFGTYTGSWKHGDLNSLFSCKKYQGPFPFKARTVIRLYNPITKDGNGKIEPLERLFKLTEPEYLDFVTPIVNEIWICEHNEGHTFYRTVNEFITKQVMGIVTTLPAEVRELRRIKLPGYRGKNEFLARVKEIKYYNLHFHPVVYEGRIKLEPAGDFLHYRQGCMFKQIHGTEMREIHYILGENRLYRSVIGNLGHNIRVGSKPKEIIGDQDHTVRCKLQSQDKFQSKYVTEWKILVLIEDFEYLKPVPARMRSTFWELIEQEVWLCQKDKPNPYSFLRIVNHLKGTKPIYEIEYYEGIRLKRSGLPLTKSGGSTVTLVEVKYIDQLSLQALKYEGEIILHDPPNKDRKTYHQCFVCDGPRIGESENEIVFEDGHFPIPVLEPNVIEPVDYHNREVSAAKEFTKGKIWVDNIGNRNRYEAIGKITEVAECSPSKEDFKELNPLVAITNANYVTKLKKEVWKCQDQDIFQGSSFYRIEVNADLKELQKPDGYVCDWGYEVVKDKERRCSMTRGVKFFNTITNTTFFYGGMCRMHHTDSLQWDVTSGSVIMNLDYQTFKFLGEYSDVQEMIYRLEQDDKKYYLPINKNGRASLRIGRRIGSTFGQITSEIFCYRDLNVVPPEFKMKYRTKVSISGSKDGEGDDVFEKYFRLYYFEVWNCEPKGSDGVNLKRVVNSFLLNPYVEENNVKDLEFYDGITWSRGKHGTGAVIWEFTEIKYLHPENLDTLKYTGAVKLKEDDLLKENIFLPSNIIRCTLNASIHEVNYLLNPTTIHETYDITDKGMSLKIGSHYEKEFNGESTMICWEVSDTDIRDKFNQHSRIKIMMFSKDGLKAMDTDTFTKIYEHTFELWDCQAKNSDGAEVKIWRAITTLIVTGSKDGKGIKQKFSSVLFYDGVKVFGERDKIEEIKYIDQADNKVMKFDGYVLTYSLPNYEPYRISKHFEREIDYRLSLTVLQVKTLKSTGSSLRIGGKPSKTIGNKDYNVLCSPMNNEGIYDKLKPRVSIMSSETHQLDFEELKKKFILSQQAWLCSDTTMAFVRVVNRLEPTNIDISTIYHFDGVMAWISKSEGKPIIQETTYVDTDYNEIIKYEGHITLKNYDVQVWKPDTYQELTPEEKQAPTQEEYNRREEEFDWHQEQTKWQKSPVGQLEPIKNTIYLSPSPHTAFIQLYRGLSFHVGEQWRETIGSKDDTFTCTIDKTSYSESYLRTNVVVDTESGLLELDDETFHDYFDVESREFSRCSNGEKSFIRVVNKLKGKKRTRRVKYFDGISLIKHQIGAGAYTANIEEHRYLEPGTLKVLKYEGKLYMSRTQEELNQLYPHLARPPVPAVPAANRMASRRY